MNDGVAKRSDREGGASLLWWVLVLGVTFFGAVAAQVDPSLPAPADTRGVEVYRANYCGACHALTAAGTTGTFGPPHDGMAAIAAERLHDPAYTGAATTPAEYVHESIVDASRYLTPGYRRSAHPMPSFDHLPEADLEALVDLLVAP